MKRFASKLMVCMMLVVALTGFVTQSIFAESEVNQNNGAGSIIPENYWDCIGKEGFSNGKASYTSITLDQNNVPYIAYIDSSNNSKATVKKFIDNSWETVGTEGFSVKNIENISIVIDKENTPYVVYNEVVNGNIYVNKFENNMWNIVGSYISSGYNASIAVDSKSTPYLVYTYNTSGELSKPNKKSGIKVLKYSSGKWMEEYGVSSSQHDINFTCPAIAIDSADIPYIAFDNNGVKVIKLSKNGSGKYIVNRSTKNPEAKSISLALDSKGTPFVAYIGAQKNNAIVLSNNKFWEVSEGKADYISIVLDSKDIPYIVYSDVANDKKAVVKKLKSGKWNTIGNKGISEGAAKHTSIALDKNNAIYIAYQDGFNKNKSTVKTFVNIMTVTFDSNGSTAIENQYVAYNSKAQKPVSPQKEGYIFENWYKDKELTEVFDFNTPVTANTTLYAKWSLITGLKVNVSSENGTVQGVRDSYSYGDTALLTASPNTGYKFDGWYDFSGNKVTNDNTLSIKVTENVSFTAKFTALPTAQLTVLVDGNGSVTDWTYSSTKSFIVGTVISLKAVASENSTFLYWKNSSGRVVSTNSVYVFEIGSNEILSASFFEKSRHLVTFKNGTGEIIKTVYLNAGEDVTFPISPAMLGYKFIGWDKTADEIKAATGDIVVKALFEKVVESVTISVYGGSGSSTYNINDYVTVVANTPESGKKFSKWEDNQGNILCYDPVFKFYASRDMVLTAIYVPETEVIVEKANISITKVTMSDDKISFVAERFVPIGNTIISHGIIVTKDTSIGTSEAGFVVDVTGVLKAESTTKGLIGTFILNKTSQLNETWYGRGFVIYKDNAGNVFSIYSNIAQMTMN